MLHVHGFALTLLPSCLRPGEYRDLTFPIAQEWLFVSLCAPPIPGVSIESLRLGTWDIVMQGGDSIPLAHGLAWDLRSHRHVVSPAVPPIIRIRASDQAHAETWVHGVIGGLQHLSREPFAVGSHRV